jgi:hypothetical protein
MYNNGYVDVRLVDVVDDKFVVGEEVEFINMEGTIVLILLVVVMLVGSYFVGSIPLVMPMSEVKL